MFGSPPQGALQGQAACLENEVSVEVFGSNRGHDVVNLQYSCVFVGCHLRRKAVEFTASHEAVNRSDSSVAKQWNPFSRKSVPDIRWREPAHPLLFIQIFAGNIVLRHLMRANFLFIGVPGVFHDRHYVGLERVSFLEQLADTLRIRTFDAGQSL